MRMNYVTTLLVNCATQPEGCKGFILDFLRWGLSLGFGACQLGQTGWPDNPRYPSVGTSPLLRLQVHTTKSALPLGPEHGAQVLVPVRGTLCRAIPQAMAFIWFAIWEVGWGSFFTIVRDTMVGIFLSSAL